MKQFYIEEWKWFKAKFLKIFIFVFIIFVLTAVSSHVLLVKNPEKAHEAFVDLAKKLNAKSSMQVTGLKRCLALFLNNVTVSLLSILLGLIPFLFISIFGTFINSFYFGVLTSMAYLEGFKIAPGLLVGILPHGIFELPAIFYATSLGIYLTFQISKRILLYPSGEESLFPLFKRIFKTWVGVIIPLLLVAAIIESFVTLFLIKIFLER